MTKKEIDFFESVEKFGLKDIIILYGKLAQPKIIRYFYEKGYDRLIDKNFDFGNLGGML